MQENIYRLKNKPLILFVLLILTGCVGATPVSVSPTALTAVAITPTFPNPTASITPTIPSLPTSTPACLEKSGVVEAKKITSQYIKDTGIQFHIYLPPCYGYDPTKRYPVLFLIHGQGFNDEQWVRIGAPKAADKLIGEGVSPFIIVMPYDKFHFSFPTTDPFDEAFIEELIPYIDFNYRTLSDREHRAIGGLSRGGGWAIHLGLNYPGLFSIVGGHSPAVFDEDASSINEWLDALSPDWPMRFFIDVGESDGLREASKWFEEELTRRDISHEWRLYTGFHNEEYWSKHVEEYLQWYVRDWR